MNRRLPWLFFLVLAALLPLLLLRGADDEERREERRYALVVGPRTYRKDQFRSLLYTENDANKLAQVFTDAGYKRVVLMTQSASEEQGDNALQPTAKNIREQLKSLLEDRKKETDTVVVAFSGHGVEFKGDKGHFFCPSDADLTDPKTLISLKEVYADLEKCNAKVKLLLVDACRNAPLATKRTKALDKVDLESETRPQKVEPPGGVVAVFSCSAGQESYESDEFKHGIFFHHVLEALRGGGKNGKTRNKKGEVNVARLFDHVSENVPDAVKKEHGPRTGSFRNSRAR